MYRFWNRYPMNGGRLGISINRVICLLSKNKGFICTFVKYRKSIHKPYIGAQLAFQSPDSGDDRINSHWGRRFMKRVLWLSGAIFVVAVLLAILVLGPTPVNAQGI